MSVERTLSEIGIKDDIQDARLHPALDHLLAAEVDDDPVLERDHRVQAVISVESCKMLREHGTVSSDLNTELRPTVDIEIDEPPGTKHPTDIW